MYSSSVIRFLADGRPLVNGPSADVRLLADDEAWTDGGTLADDSLLAVYADLGIIM